MLLNRRDAIVSLAASVATAAVPKSATSTVLPLALRRGVNLSHWFAQSFEDNNPRHFSDFVNIMRMSNLSRRGFDHVRLPVEPAVLFEDSPPRRLRTTTVKFLHNAIDLLHSHGLAVVLDMHPVGNAKEVLLTPAGASAFLDGWRNAASEFCYSNKRLFFEVLNEPIPLAGEAWWKLQGQAIDAIHERNPNATVIANGGNWSNIEDIIQHRAYRRPNVIYSVHYYSPILFTQQASQWGWQVAARVANLSWPVAVEQADVVAEQVTTDKEAFSFVRDAIANGSFTSASMKSAFGQLKRWQQANGNPPIYVGEFGVVAKGAPSDDRVKWIRAAREGFESNGWGWAFWDLSPSFGLLRASPGNLYAPWNTMQLDDKMLNALGLSS